MNWLCHFIISMAEDFINNFFMGINYTSAVLFLILLVVIWHLLTTKY
ncbi:hypothetical protein 18R059_00014 [Fowlpox virus]|nr:ALPV-031 [Albatrosspox virus]URH24990.1 hypothetical protein 13D121_00014 [Fowlpox virus]URH26037.1 hypothetical protein 18R056_00014 [Fowlpox virus]URH26300.1 hypothetical protein 18R059_00014 [Fowlpox virus]URH26825.1 hypothetical protein 2755_00014 [Fowlpox virus]